MFAKRVRRCALYGAATGTWTKETTGMLLCWGNRMLCKMLNARTRPNEAWSEFQSRRVTAARRAFHVAGHESLLTEALFRQFALVRKSFWDDTRHESHRRGLEDLRIGRSQKNCNVCGRTASLRRPVLGFTLHSLLRARSDCLRQELVFRL